jgi:potassium-transporting ATPase KdpC subunit
MRSQIRPALVALAALTFITGVVYPAAVTVIARLAFPSQATGSVIRQGNEAVGSALIGQPFGDPRYFWPRPSATALVPYNAAASTGSNLAPTNPALATSVTDRVAALKLADPTNNAPVPVDLVTASGSGLDPHISPAAARYQVARVARARKIAEVDVQALVDRHTEGRALRIFGEPHVNVLRLNLDLDGGDVLRGANDGHSQGAGRMNKLTSRAAHE